MKKNCFLNSQKFPIREIRKILYENPIFFPRQALPTILFALDFHYTGDTPYRVWFDVDNSLPDEKDLFLKISFSRNSKSSAWNPNFFSGQGIPFFSLHSHFTGDTPYRVWFDLDNSLTLFSKFSKIPNSRNLQNSVWKPNFFPRQAIPTILFASDSHYSGDTPFRVWFDLENSITRWKRPSFKILFSGNSKSSVWSTNFFRTRYMHFFFALRSHYTGDTAYRVQFDLYNSLTRWKRIIFEILKNSQLAKFAKFRMKTQFFSQANCTKN